MIRDISTSVPSPSDLFFWIGCGFQVFGVLMVVGLGLRLRAEDRSHATKALFVNVVAACAYFALAVGQLNYNIGGNHQAEIPRYIDWLITTPLLLLSLLVIALPGVHHFSRQRERTTMIGAVVGTQAFLILTGVFAILNSSPGIKWTWFGVSCVAQLVLYYLLYVKVWREASAHGGKNVTLFKRMVVFLSAWWFLYPVAWALGPEAFNVWGNSGDALIYTILDIVAKVVFNIVLLSAILRLSRTVADVKGVSTIELLAGVDEIEESLDHHAGRQHLQPATSGGVLVGAGAGVRSDGDGPAGATRH